MSIFVPLGNAMLSPFRNGLRPPASVCAVIIPLARSREMRALTVELGSLSASSTSIGLAPEFDMATITGSAFCQSTFPFPSL